MNRFDTFKIILMTGEKELNLHYKDYQDAYSYSLQYHSMISKHFVEHFTNHSDLNICGISLMRIGKYMLPSETAETLSM